MPNDTTQQPQMQAPQVPLGGQPPQSPQQPNPEEMLIKAIQEIDQKIEELSQRMDALEQGQ